MGNENFIKDHLWIAIMVVLLFTAFVGYALNKNLDPEEELEEDKEEEISNENTDRNDEDK